MSSILDQLLGHSTPSGGGHSDTTTGDPVPSNPAEATHPRERTGGPGHAIVGEIAPLTPPLTAPLDDVKLAINDMLSKLDRVVEQAAATYEVVSDLDREARAREIDIEDQLHLTVLPTKLNFHGRRYSAILYSGTTPQAINVARPGLASYQKILVAGWNMLNAPEGTMLSLPTGATAIDVIFIASYHPFVLNDGISANNAYLFNQAANGGAGGLEIERSAAGEGYLAPGPGGNVAFEYEDIGLNGPTSWVAGGGVAQFDKAKGVQGKGLTTLAIASAATGQPVVTLSSAAPSWLIPGAHVRLANSIVAADATAEDFAVVSVAGTAVTLANNIANSGHTLLIADTFAANGPGLNAFTPHGLGIEEEALFDPVSGLFFLERAATQDAVPPQNVVMESIALWNGAGMDRQRGPIVFKDIAAIAVTINSGNTPTSVWAPAAGKKFRVMGYALSLSVAGFILFHDLAAQGGGGIFHRTPALLAGTPWAPPMFGNGMVSGAANNQLWIDASAAGTVTGSIWGIEE